MGNPVALKSIAIAFGFLEHLLFIIEQSPLLGHIESPFNPTNELPYQGKVDAIKKEIAGYMANIKLSATAAEEKQAAATAKGIADKAVGAAQLALENARNTAGRAASTLSTKTRAAEMAAGVVAGEANSKASAERKLGELQSDLSKKQGEAKTAAEAVTE